MSKMPRVAIVGRPNVGKSTLFNVLTRSRQALVRNQPGVTRDVLEGQASWWGTDFTVLDTGGITDSADDMANAIRDQVLKTLGQVDALILVFDGKSGLMPEDKDIIRMAKQSGRPFVSIINKVDRFEDSEKMQFEFAELGCDFITASFEQREGLPALIDWVKLQVPVVEREEKSRIRITVMGKPNAGKSSLCNFLLHDQRMIVSPEAGTTRDPVAADFQFGGEDYTLVDTAGLRRSAAARQGLEGLSILKAKEAIHKSDVLLLMIDAVIGPTEQDARLLQLASEENILTIAVINKMDLPECRRAEFRQSLRDRMSLVFHFSNDLPMVFVSAKTGAGVHELMHKIQSLWLKAHTKIPTSKLNKFFTDSIKSAPSPVYGSTNVKFYYLTQTKQMPPAFIAFANHPEGVTNSYRRFLIKRLKNEFDLEGVPIRIFCMKSGRDLDHKEY